MCIFSNFTKDDDYRIVDVVSFPAWSYEYLCEIYKFGELNIKIIKYKILEIAKSEPERQVMHHYPEVNFLQQQGSFKKPERKVPGQTGDCQQADRNRPQQNTGVLLNTAHHMRGFNNNYLEHSNKDTILVRNLSFNIFYRVIRDS